MSEWQKDLSAVGFEVADLVQRVRTMVLATGGLSDRVPEGLYTAVSQARFSMDAAVALIEGAAERLLQLDDQEQAAVLTEAGRCGEESPTSTFGRRVHCYLAVGHDGPHRDGDGSEWLQ